MAEDPIVTTRDRPGSYDAIASAKPDEPLFPIQGGDPFGPPTVLHWAALARAAALREENREKAERLLRKASDAEHVAWAMISYQRGAEELTGNRATYSDRTETLADEGRKRRETLIRGTARLHNALAEALEVAAQLAKLRVHPEDEVRIREAAEALKEAAFNIEPRRGREQS